MTFQTTDKILVNRGGVDYQAELAPLLGGGLDDIINAPVVKEVKYQLWEDAKGRFVPMDLIDGDGGNGSTWKALTPYIQESFGNGQGQVSIDGVIQYVNSTNPNHHQKILTPCMASVDNLSVEAVDLNDSSISFSDRISTFAEQGYFHSHGTMKGGNYQPDTTDYKLVLTFDDIHGEQQTLYVQVSLLVYIAMRREDIDLREMEALDAELKN